MTPSGSHFGRFSHAGTPTLFEWRPLAHPMGVPKPPFSRCFCKVAPLCLLQGPSWGQLGPRVGPLSSSSAPLKRNLVHIGLPSCPPGAFQTTFGTILGQLGDILAPSTLRPFCPTTLQPFWPTTFDPSTLLPNNPSTLLPKSPSTLVPNNHSTPLPNNPSTLLPNNPALRPFCPTTLSTLLPNNPSTLLPSNPSTLLPSNPSIQQPFCQAALRPLRPFSPTTLARRNARSV